MENNKVNKKIRTILCVFISILGFSFLIWYIFNAGFNVIYQDYIRVVDQNIATGQWKTFPAISTILNGGLLTWVNNWINIKFLSFSPLYDMVLGVCGLTMISAIVIKYAYDSKIKTYYIVILSCVVFSLNKWEMLLNGTGWIHFWAFAGFYLHFILFDYVYKNNYHVKRKWRLLLLLCPLININILAGMYCAVYSITCIICYIFLILLEKRSSKKWNKELLYDLSSIIFPLIIYVVTARISGNSLALGYSFGNGRESFFVAFFSNPIYFIKFFVLSFSSMFLGIESMLDSESIQLIIGGVIIVIYVMSLVLYLKNKLYNKTIFPALLLVSGFLNHGIILFSRWRFQSVKYGMSSRYALQYQSGIIGIFLILYFVNKAGQDISRKRKTIFMSVWGAFVIFILIGMMRTTLDEIKKAPYRKAYGTTLNEIGINFKNEPDERLLLFNADGDASYVRSALQTLQENKLNIFKDVFYNFSMEDIVFEGVQEREDNPWKTTAGIIKLENGEEYILLTPNTSVSFSTNAVDEIYFLYEIYYKVREESDGAELELEILDSEEETIYDKEIVVSSMKDETIFRIDLTKYEMAKRIKLTCSGGENNNENADWVMIKILD